MFLVCVKDCGWFFLSEVCELIAAVVTPLMMGVVRLCQTDP